jgi:amidohydrolase
MDKKEIVRIIGEIRPWAVRLRRALHERPELSGQERASAALIAKTLRKTGLTPELRLGGTAVVCRMVNGPGRTVVLRADTDALPIVERTGLSFASKNPGIMHACGHDLHTAALAGAAAVLDKIKNKWRGTIVLLFQPSEEMEPGGAQKLIKTGAFPPNADAVFGLHVSTDHTTGQIGLRSGSDYAGVLNFTITITGRGGHAASPRETVNPIVCAGVIIGKLQSLTDLRPAGSQPGIVVSVGTLQAGTRNNIVPDEAVFQGTVRTHSKRTEAIVKRHIERIVARETRSHKTSAAVEFAAAYPPTWNDRRLTVRMSKSFGELIGKDLVIVREKPIFFAEDFAYYQEKTPGLFVHLGVRPAGTKNVPGIHSARFKPDEKAIGTGILAHVAFVLEIAGV